MMARRIENEDGMYPKLTIPWEEMTAEDYKRLQKITDEMFDVDAILNRMERAVGPLLGNAVEPCTSKIQGDARELGQRIAKLRRYLESSNTRLAALEGIEIGWLSERIHARQFEAKVIQVNRATRKLRAAATEQAHPQQEIDKAVALYKRLLKKRPNAKKKVLQEQVRSETKIPPRTLRRHLGKR
jgi:hypothetical protein